MVKADNERLRFLTREEVRALLDDLEKRHPQLHDMALLSLRTGLRPTEVFKLRGQDVDGNACGLYIIQKGGKRVFVRVPEDMSGCSRRIRASLRMMRGAITLPPAA